MKTTALVRLLAVAGLASTVLAPALAQDVGHPYMGLSVGQSRADINAPRLTGELLPGVSAGASRSDEKDTAYKLFGGYQFNRNIALEGGYFDLGKSSFNADTAPAGALAARTRVHGVNLDLVATLPLSERFSVQARAGVQHAWSRSSFDGQGAAGGLPAGGKINGNGAKYGVGVQYELSPAMLLRADLERYNVHNIGAHRNNIDVASVSLVFPFGAAPTR